MNRLAVLHSALLVTVLALAACGSGGPASTSMSTSTDFPTADQPAPESTSTMPMATDPPTSATPSADGTYITDFGSHTTTRGYSFIVTGVTLRATVSEGNIATNLPGVVSLYPGVEVSATVTNTTPGRDLLEPSVKFSPVWNKDSIVCSDLSPVDGRSFTDLKAKGVIKGCYFRGEFLTLYEAIPAGQTVSGIAAPNLTSKTPPVEVKEDKSSQYIAAFERPDYWVAERAASLNEPPPLGCAPRATILSSLAPSVQIVPKQNRLV